MSTLGRIGGGLMIAGSAALLYTLATATAATLNASGVLLGVGAAGVAIASPGPLSARATRFGLALFGAGLVAAAITLTVEANYRDPEGGNSLRNLGIVVPLLLDVAAIPLGCLVTSISLLRSSGPARGIGLLLPLGMILWAVMAAGSAGPAGPDGPAGPGAAGLPPVNVVVGQAGLALSALSVAALGVLALDVPALRRAALT